MLKNLLEVLGLTLIVAGVAMLSIPVALIVAGSLVGALMERD